MDFLFLCPHSTHSESTSTASQLTSTASQKGKDLNKVPLLLQDLDWCKPKTLLAKSFIFACIKPNFVFFLQLAVRDAKHNN